MTEQERWERISNGYLWEDTEEFLAHQARVKDLMYEFNHSRPSEEDKRRALLPQIFAEIGEHCIVQQPITLMRGKTVHIGDYCYFNSNTFFVDDYDIYIGDWVLFGPNVTISTTGPYGFLMNVVSTCAFTVPAALIYRRFHSQKGAIGGLALGVVVLAATMVLWNYIITPFYMGVDRSVVAGMLVPTFLPFNLIKSGINLGITLVLYKPLVNALRKAHLIPQTEGKASKRSVQIGFTLASIFVLATFVLLFLVFSGVL